MLSNVLPQDAAVTPQQLNLGYTFLVHNPVKVKKKKSSILPYSVVGLAKWWKIFSCSGTHSSHNQQRFSTWKSCLFENDIDASKFKVHRDITGARPGPPERDPKIASLLEAAWTSLRRWFWMRGGSNLGFKWLCGENIPTWSSQTSKFVCENGLRPLPVHPLT